MSGSVGVLGEIVQGTAVAVAVDADGPLAGVFLRGASGTGKSDLALRLMEACPFRRTRLVADDVVIIREEDGRLIVRCPKQIRDLIEIRAVGIVAVGSDEAVRLRLICDLDRRTSRLPGRRTEKLIAGSGCTLPVLAFEPFEASAPHKIRHAARAVLARHFDASRQDGRVAKKGRRNT